MGNGKMPLKGQIFKGICGMGEMHVVERHGLNACFLLVGSTCLKGSCWLNWGIYGIIDCLLLRRPMEITSSLASRPNALCIKGLCRRFCLEWSSRCSVIPWLPHWVTRFSKKKKRKKNIKNTKERKKNYSDTAEGLSLCLHAPSPSFHLPSEPWVESIQPPFAVHNMEFSLSARHRSRPWAGISSASEIFRNFLKVTHLVGRRTRTAIQGSNSKALANAAFWSAFPALPVLHFLEIVSVRLQLLSRFFLPGPPVLRVRGPSVCSHEVTFFTFGTLRMLIALGGMSYLCLWH